MIILSTVPKCSVMSSQLAALEEKNVKKIKLVYLSICRVEIRYAAWKHSLSTIHLFNL